MWSQDIGISYGHKPDDENKDFIDKQIKILSANNFPKHETPLICGSLT
jgi:hypothetical protein